MANSSLQLGLNALAAGGGGGGGGGGGSTIQLPSVTGDFGNAWVGHNLILSVRRPA